MYKLRIYKICGVCRGDLDHEEFFETMENLRERYEELFVYELYSLNPTAWKSTEDGWERIGSEELKKADRKCQSREFLGAGMNRYAIMQLKDSEETALERFSSIKELDRMGLQPNVEHYRMVYEAPLFPYDNRDAMLERLYLIFNTSRPEGFTGHSLSVSDIVVLYENGETSCHFVDPVGFVELPGFLRPEDCLEN